jgi:hypothetical protein
VHALGLAQFVETSRRYAIDLTLTASVAFQIRGCANDFMQPFFGHHRLGPVAIICENASSSCRYQSRNVSFRVSKVSCQLGEDPIDLDTAVIRAIRFRLKDPAHQLLPSPCRLTTLPAASRTPTFDPGVAFHYDVSVDPSLQRGIRDRATTIRAFERDVIGIHGCNGVLPLSIKVNLTNDEGWRQLAVVHGRHLL